jgi:uncharacterized protein (UPF0261 family)
METPSAMPRIIPSSYSGYTPENGRHVQVTLTVPEPLSIDYRTLDVARTIQLIDAARAALLDMDSTDAFAALADALVRIETHRIAQSELRR